MPGPVNPKLPVSRQQNNVSSLPQPLSIVGSGVAKWDVTQFKNFTLTANAATFNIPLPMGLTPGAGGMLTITQDASGSRVVTWNSTFFRTAGGTSSGSKPTLSTGAGVVDEIAWYSPDGIYVDLSAQLAFAH